MGKDLVIKPSDDITTKVNKLFSSVTPAKFIKQRVGRGGGKFKYVEIGYVTNELNRVFGPFWEFRVVDKGIGKRQIWVQGQLTIKDPKTGFSVTKENFGGVDIKYPTGTFEHPIDIADDLKAAVADCTKKCASMYGVAADVFFKEQSQYDQMAPDVDVEDNLAKTQRQSLVGKFFAICSERGMDGDAAKEKLKSAFRKEHMEDVTDTQIEHAIKLIEEKYEVVGKGNPPRKIGESVVVTAAPEVIEPAVEPAPVQAGPMYLCQGAKHNTGHMEDQVAVPVGEFCSTECQMSYYNVKPSLDEKLATWDKRRVGIRKMGGNA